MTLRASRTQPKAGVHGARGAGSVQFGHAKEYCQQEMATSASSLINTGKSIIFQYTSRYGTVL